jgi:hypothetical protein
MQQAEVKMLEKVVKVYTHRLRGTDIQFITVVVGGMKDCTVQ